MGSDNSHSPTWSEFFAPSDTLSDGSEGFSGVENSDDSDNSGYAHFWDEKLVYKPRGASDSVPHEQFGDLDEYYPRVPPSPPRPPPVTERNKRGVHLRESMVVELSDDESDPMEEDHDQDDPTQGDVLRGGTDFKMPQPAPRLPSYPTHGPNNYRSPYVVDAASRTNMDQINRLPMRHTMGFAQAVPGPIDNPVFFHGLQALQSFPPFQTPGLYRDPVRTTQPASQTMTMTDHRGQTISVNSVGGHTISIVDRGETHSDFPASNRPLPTRIYYNGVPMVASMPRPQQPQQPPQPPPSSAPEAVIGIANGAARGVGSEMPPGVNQRDELSQAAEAARRRNRSPWDVRHFRRRMEVIRKQGDERRRAMRERERNGRGRETQ